MSHKIWEINGISLELNLQDADANERCENAFEKMEENEKALPKDGKNSERIRQYCQLFRQLYDDIFGAGTSEKIFNGLPTSVDVYENIYYQFLDFINAQKVGIEMGRAKRIEKYTPVNRQQRRAAGKKK